MTSAQVLEAARACMEFARWSGARPARIGEGASLRASGDLSLIVSHLLYMEEQIAHLLAEGRTEKAMRWLGFMQGVVWVLGTPLSELKAMNRAE